MEAMELKLQTTEMDSKHLMPSYLINLLVYFYIKTSKPLKDYSQYSYLENFNMARQLIKSRRYVLDTGHIEPSNHNMTSQAQKKKNQTRTLIKNFS